MQLHDGCQYVLSHGPHTETLAMKRAVKQGCTLAPLLWVIFSVYIRHHIGLATDYAWMMQCLTLYADDTHACWQVRCKADLCFMADCVRKIYHVYETFGMKLNPQKSSFISGLGGTACAQWVKRHRRGGSGGPFLNFGTPHGPLWIPLRRHFTYLGIVASYDCFEDRTLRARICASTVARQRLLRVLHSGKYLSLHKRLELYTACVRSSTLYGLAVVGITRAGVRQLCSYKAKHIRAIAKAPSHIYRETAEHLEHGFSSQPSAGPEHDQHRPYPSFECYA